MHLVCDAEITSRILFSQRSCQSCIADRFLTSIFNSSRLMTSACKNGGRNSGQLCDTLNMCARREGTAVPKVGEGHV